MLKYYEPEHHYALGMRIEVRDAEWRIQRIDPTSYGYILTCTGLSELVRGLEAKFLTHLEGEENIRILAPEQTTLIADTSNRYKASLLYLDTMIRQSTPTDQRIHMGHRAALDIVPFQFDPALQALSQPRSRILIADAVGLGKTLEAGILVSELIARGRGKRILVLATKAMLSQFQHEFWTRFTIPLTRLDSIGLQRVRNNIPANHNPFHYYDRSIVSIDTLKQDAQYRHYLEKAYWDIIIIDEAHNVAERAQNSLRARLASLIATRSDTLIMLTATPHDGRAESFASLIDRLDPTAIADRKNYTHQDYRDKGLVIRRLKKDVRDQLGNLPRRQVTLERTTATAAEEAAYAALTEARFLTLNRGNQVGQLFRTTLTKALFSSPAACLSTINNRMAKLRKKPQNADIQHDLHSLEQLAHSLQNIDTRNFSKYQQLVTLLKSPQQGLQWSRESDDRLVIFTESLQTLEFLQQHLPQDIKLKKNQLAILRGDQKDTDIMQTVDAFNRGDSPIRLLLCSDVGAEGINLHHLSHRMVHFDIPWSFMIFQQRNGRIDRYGQTQTPRITYLITDSGNPQVQGDNRVLEILTQKDTQASENIGDPSELQGLFDVGEEENAVGHIMEKDPEQVDLAALLDQMLDSSSNPETAALDTLIPEIATSTHQDLQELLADPTSLYPSDFDWAHAGLQYLKEQTPIQFSADSTRKILQFTAPHDFVQRLGYLPREIRPDHDDFTLTPDKQAIQRELDQCRNQDSPWPNIQYLWPLHPAMEWLRDRILNAFGRHSAPVLYLGHMQPDECCFILQGGFPNQQGHPVIQHWGAIAMHSGTRTEHLSLEQALERYQLVPDQTINPGIPPDIPWLGEQLPTAVEHFRQSLYQERHTHLQHMQPELEKTLARLDALRTHQEQTLFDIIDESNQAEHFKARRREDKQQYIERVFREYKTWIQQTHQLEEEPYIQLAITLTGRRQEA